uniref:Uncharacterized protein n=1 Tax=Anguilla anguilla TaxID=7936 RepID=A0A0E9RLN0_ANGAN
MVNGCVYEICFLVFLLDLGNSCWNLCFICFISLLYLWILAIFYGF